MKLIPTLALFGLLVLGVLLGYHIDNTPVKAKAESAATSANAVATPTPAVESYPTLAADMNAAIAASPSLSGSATFIDLATGKEYDAGNYTQNYEAASTSKLVAVFDYLHQVELGKASLTQNIDGQQAQDIIMRMIVYSDNDAWDKLNGYLHLWQEQNYANSLGVKAIIQDGNMQFSTPSLARLLLLFYQGKLVSVSHQAMVYNYMSHTTMNALIPAALPADATVYHKYGQIDGVLNDVAIIEYQGHKFILVVYTDGGQYGAQADLIHTVTTAAFNDVTKG